MFNNYIFFNMYVHITFLILILYTGVSLLKILFDQQLNYFFSALAKPVIGPMLDLTYPNTAIFTGAYFNWTLSSTFGEDLNIEDLWLPFFCVSTDITAVRERVHTKGTFWKYCR